MRTFALALLVLPAACASDRGAAPEIRTDPPVGEWRLVADPGGAAPGPTLSVASGGRLAGTGGCNRYVGSWRLDASRRTLGAVAATRRMCEPDVSAAEVRFLDALSRVAGWYADGADGADRVLVGADGAPLLRFAPLER